MTNILVAVDHRENCRLLVSYLEQHYIIVSPTAAGLDLPFDLGVFDGHALSRYWPEIQRLKRAEQLLVLPILLVTPRQDINMITRQLWQSIDDIIFVPIDKAELFVRIEILLRARHLSLDLGRRNAQLQDEIAAHKATEQALRESEERFQAALKNTPLIVSRSDRDLRYTWLYNQPGDQGDHILGKRDDEIEGYHNTQALMTLKQAVVDTGVGERSEIEMEIHGAYKAYDVTVEPIKEDEDVVGLRSAAFDITERKRAEQRIATLYNLTSDLAGSLTLEDVAETIIQYGITTLGATAGSVVMYDHATETVEIIKAVGYPTDVTQTWKRFSVHIPAAPLAAAIKTNTALLFNTVADWQAVMPSGPQAIIEQTRHKAWASLPFSIDKRVIGGLGLSFTTPQVFEKERDFLLTLAQQCAQALENVRLTQRLQESAVVAERQRLARDLHDAVSQALFAASTIADVVPMAWEKNSDKGKDLLRQVTVLNRAALAEMRTLLFELRPEVVIKTSLKMLFMQLLQALKGKKFIETDFVTTGNDIHLPEDVHVAFYRIVQESLNNVVKHSQATAVQIFLDYEAESVHVKVIDNGLGFDMTQSKSGLGLNGMRERAELAGIVVDIYSGLGQGTRVEVVWQAAPETARR